MSELLFENDVVIPISMKVASKLGIKEAMVLQQVNYWMDKNEKLNRVDTHFHDGKWWVFNTFENWNEQISCMGIATLKRVFANLENMGILITGNFNQKAYDHTKWYTIDKNRLETLVNTDSIKMIQSNVSNCTNRTDQNDTNYTKDYTENTYTKITEKGLHFERPSDNRHSRSYKTYTWKSEEDYNKYLIRTLPKNIRACMKGYDRKKIDQVVDLFITFFKRFYVYREEFHPPISKDKLTGIIDTLCDKLEDDRGYIDTDLVRKTMTQFFSVKRKNDYHIYIYANEMILNTILAELKEDRTFEDFKIINGFRY